MKRKRMLGLGIFFLILILFPIKSFANNEYFNPIEPNKYEEKNIELPTQYIHEKGLLEMRKKLPANQESLTFEPKSEEIREELMLSLFQSADKKTNTITAKINELELFSEELETEDYFVASPEDTRENQATKGLSVVISTIAVGVVGYLLFGIVPKLTQNG